jgi:hypothetical protein
MFDSRPIEAATAGLLLLAVVGIIAAGLVWYVGGCCNARPDSPHGVLPA